MGTQYKIGATVYFSKTISEFDVYQFAGITGDLNPLHVDEEYSKKNRYGKRIAQGMLVSSFICRLLGTELPGLGTIHVSQQLDFIKPVFIGDTITVKLEVTEITERRMRIRSSINNQKGETVVDGSSVVIPPRA